MTQTLKKQLTALCVASLCSGVLMWNGRTSWAQSSSGNSIRRAIGIKTPRVLLTRDQAAKNFLALLQIFDTEARPQSRAVPNAAMLSSFSIKSENEVREGLVFMLQKMAFQMRHTKLKTQSKDAVVRSLILIPEGKGWGVDMLETYAKWGDLKGTAKAKEFAHLASLSEEVRSRWHRDGCMENMKQVAFSALQYTQDNNEQFPHAQSWMDEVRPYNSKDSIFNCPELGRGKFGYAFNLKVSRQRLLAPQPGRTILIYETSILKRNAYGSGENLAFRHQNGANYAFADGHVKWFSKTGTPSFKLKP